MISRGDEILVEGFIQGCPEPASAGPNGPKDRMFRFLAQDNDVGRGPIARSASRADRQWHA